MTSVSLCEESDRIRARMSRVRSRLHGDLDSAVDSTMQLLDWKYYVRTFPLQTLGVVTTFSYLLAPRRKVVPTVKVDRESIEEVLQAKQSTHSEPSTPSLLSTLGMALGSAVVRMSIGLLTSKAARIMDDLTARQSNDSRPATEVSS